MSSLGKGLESLIPPKNGSAVSGQAPQKGQGQPQQPAPPIVPEEELPAVSAVELPPGLVLDPESELDAPPEEELLPAPEAAPFSPTSSPQASSPQASSGQTARKPRERENES